MNKRVHRVFIASIIVETFIKISNITATFIIIKKYIFRGTLSKMSNIDEDEFYVKLCLFTLHCIITKTNAHRFNIMLEFF